MIFTARCYASCLVVMTIQELSYRQQIARQLRAEYAEGIYRHKYYTVTLKSRWRVTQDHWKWNHWTDHTRLSSSHVIWRWILGHSSSLKVVPFESLGTLSYSPYIVTMAVSLAISEILSVKQLPWNLGLGSFKVIENGAVRQTMYDFLLVRHRNYSSILYRLRVTYLTLNIIVTLKCGLEVTQGHWNWCHSKAWVRFPIRLL